MRGSVVSGGLLLVLAAGLLFVFGCNDDSTPTGLTSNGSIMINAEPNTLDFPWSLTGAGGTQLAGEGDTLLVDMTPGDYTIQWHDEAGWITPPDSIQIKRLGAGAVVTFNATYRPTAGNVSAGQIIIDTSPDSLQAPWTLTGPDGFTQSGNGDLTFNDMDPGTYSISWGEVDGFAAPLDETKELAEDEGIVFLGQYVSQEASQIRFVTIPAGEFQMGSSVGADGAQANEYPRHLVRLTRAFEMSVTEINWAQFERVMGYNPSAYGDYCASCPRHPVESVTWLEAVQFCNTLSELEGLTPAYTISGTSVTWDPAADGYRLPTEAEWEYACRAGTVTSFASGDIDLFSASCYQETHLDTMGWYCDNSMQVPHEVATLSPNGWGLYDMHGNVWEWVWDWVTPHYDRVTQTVGQLQQVDGSPVVEGSVVVGNAQPYAGSSHAIQILGRVLELDVSDLGLTLSGLTAAVVDFGDLVNIGVNGAPLYRGPLADAPAEIAPGVTLQLDLSVVEDDIGTGLAGTLTLVGDVQELIIGGENIWLDDIVFQDADTSIFGRDRVLDYEMSPVPTIFQLSTSAELACTVVDPVGPPSGTDHMLRGGGFASTPAYCRSAARSNPDKGRYAGFRIVRTVD